MLQGIYSVNFRSSHDHGDGLVVADQGKVNGGDKYCVYRGTYKGEGDNLEAEIHVTLHGTVGVTIFGPNVREFHLRLTGNASGMGLSLSGQVVEQPGLKMTLNGRKLADVA